LAQENPSDSRVAETRGNPAFSVLMYVMDRSLKRFLTKKAEVRVKEQKTKDSPDEPLPLESDL
jgi:hypothetical protein